MENPELDHCFLRFAKVSVKAISEDEDGVFAKVHFLKNDAICLYAGVRFVLPIGKKSVDDQFGEYQIQVPGGVLAPPDHLMSLPGGYESLDTCGHLVNHSDNPNVEFHPLPVRAFEGIPNVQSALESIKQWHHLQGVKCTYVVLIVASRNIKKGEQLFGDYKKTM